MTWASSHWMLDGPYISRADQLSQEVRVRREDASHGNKEKKRFKEKPSTVLGCVRAEDGIGKAEDIGDFAMRFQCQGRLVQ